MPEMSHGERLDRLEQIVQILAEDQVSLQKIVADLATTTRVGFDQIREQIRETNQILREQALRTDERFRQTDERFRQTDERIDKLVSAMGEFIRRSDK